MKKFEFERAYTKYMASHRSDILTRAYNSGLDLGERMMNGIMLLSMGEKHRFERAFDLGIHSREFGTKIIKAIKFIRKKFPAYAQEMERAFNDGLEVGARREYKRW